MKKKNTTVVVVVIALSIAWCFISAIALIDYVKYKGQTVAEMIVPANIQDRPIAQTTMHTQSSMQSVRSSVYTNATQPEQHFATTDKPTYTPSTSHRVYESSNQEIHHIGGGMSAPIAANSGHTATQQKTSAPNYTFVSVAVPVRTSEVHNIVSVAAEAEQAAIAQSAPARQAAAAQLPPPPTINPDPSSQLGFETPIGEGWCMLALGLLMLGVIYRRKEQKIAA